MAESLSSRSRLPRLLLVLKRLVRLPWGSVIRELLEDHYADYRDLRLCVMDIRPKSSRNPQAVVDITTNALNRISDAGQGLGELVTSHLDTVVAAENPLITIGVSVRTYASDFRGHEGKNAHYLACQLVWAATAVRLGWNGRQSGRDLDSATTHQACWEAVKRFLSQFDDAYAWMEYMDPDRPALREGPPPSAA